MLEGKNLMLACPSIVTGQLTKLWLGQTSAQQSQAHSIHEPFGMLPNSNCDSADQKCGLPEAILTAWSSDVVGSQTRVGRSAILVEGEKPYTPVASL